jgi:NADPH:quinone reductase-like Zn-dependent oxidoreductase
MIAVTFTGAGGREVMRVQERPDPAPRDHEVLVRATHAGLNPADLVQRAGHYPAPKGSPQDVPGLEVAGTVVACGSAVTSWREGDRVFGLVGGGGLADTVAAHERHLARIPDALGDRDAAAVPEAFITAHDAVFTRAALGMGETLLVNGATGGVGSAGVQLGVAIGARVLAYARRHHEQLAALGAEPIATLEDAAGVDVVLELIGAVNLAGSLEALALCGRIIVVGTGAGAETKVSLRTLMSKRAGVMGTMLRARPVEEKAAAVQAFARHVVPLLSSGRVAPLVDRVFAAERAADAFDHLAAPGKLGKVLLEFPGS